MIDEYGIKGMNDAHEFVKMLTVETIQVALDYEYIKEWLLDRMRIDFAGKFLVKKVLRRCIYEVLAK